jgi:hypothetical protein
LWRKRLSNLTVVSGGAELADLRARYSIVVGVLQPFRGAVQQFSLAPAERPGPGRVDRLPDTVAVGDHQKILRHVPDPVALPGLFLDALRQRGVQFGELIGQPAVSLFALPQRLLRQHLLGDVGMRADQADRLSAVIALDGRVDRNPPRLAVGRADDPVLHAVLAHIAGDGVAEFLLGRFAILGMDAPDPVLMGLVGRIGGQPVDQQIFRRPPIAETGGQIDLEAADPPELLHASQFGFALPQRRGGQIVAGHVAADHEHAADAVVFVDRTVTVGPVDLLQPAVTRHRNQLVLMPGGAAAAHDLFDLRADDGPDFRPARAAGLAERARMTLRPHGLAIGIVIELDELRAPPDEHRVVGVEQDAHRGAQALRPSRGLAQRGCRPVICPRQRAHLPAAGEEIRRTRSVDLQHQGMTGGQVQPKEWPELNVLSQS